MSTPRVVRIWCCVLALAAAPVGGRCDAQVPPPRIAAAADSLLGNLHRRGLFGGAVVLARGGREVYARGFGAANAAAGVAFTPDTPVDGASVAKPFTAAAVHMLAREGKLRLDDPVRRHLPEYPHAATTVRHLLSHSAGLPGYAFFEPFIPKGTVLTTPRFLEVLRQRDVAPAFAPGTRFRYDNMGFDVAALLVERVTGETWEGFLRRRVFGPLGMDPAFLRPARLADWRGVRTMSYRRAGDSLVVHDVFDDEGFYGSANLYLSARASSTGRV
jgi:CubicO group peptidase (beta-lactamase class C family)